MMDTEQQVRLNFLEEAEEYFEQLESILLNLATADDRPQQLDAALRAAHSIKGSAGMMGFMPLSQVAHRLEDSFKILRARLIPIDTELETLLLQGIDTLRAVKQCHYEALPVDQDWMDAWATPIFDRLHDRLGDVTENDENTILAANEDVDITIVMFTSGVEGALDEFETRRPTLSGEALRQSLLQVTNKMLEFGLIGAIEPFILLCTSIQVEASTAVVDRIGNIADEALELWQRSSALVALSRLEQLPSGLEWSVANVTTPDTALVETAAMAMPEINSDDLSNLMASLNALDGLNPIAIEPSLPVMVEIAAPVAVMAPEPEPPKPKAAPEATIRVPVEQLRQINILFSTLILDRNGVNLRLGQFEELLTLLRQRMNHLEGFNLELRRWYDKASMEDLVSPNSSSVNPTLAPNPAQLDSGFDALEMDQYSELHLLAQEQMETIVKLQEVISDINLTHQDMQQANHSLNLTSRNLQTRITRTQMRPFEDIVGRFPRVMRDYAIKYGKPVNLKIEGEHTLFERYALDVLTDPINHLLRNAFDHGIESAEIRQSAGKSTEGTITIRASQRGNRAIVTMSDDGGGINLDKIRQKVRQYGIPEAQIREFSEAKLLDMIFDAGFSTADQVTELSGRGVGMDVVKSNLKQVQGDITVTTALGKGTTFTIAIPLSLSIFRVMLLESNGFTFAVSLDVVKEILPQAAIGPNRDGTITWQGQDIPLHNPEPHWQFAPGTKLNELAGNPMINHPLVIVIGDGDRVYGLPVKRFWAEQEVSIRPLSSPIPLPVGFSGVTTLGDGRIVPLLDPIALLDAHQVAATRAAAIANNSSAAPSNIIPPTNKNNAATILVVDDSIHARRYLALSLEKAGYAVEQARDGREAVDQLLGGLQVEAVICDVEMPRLDGYGVLSEIKTRPEFRSLPIAMLTSRSNEKHRKLAMNLGATAYFSKPYNEQELLQTLATLIAG